MARKTSKRQKSKSTSPPQQSKAAQAVSRRAALQRMALYGIGGAVVLGGGAAFAVDFRSKLAESDLSVLGNGTPTIVQIHDPQCPSCAALQKQARIALKSFDAGDVNYRVANIRSTEGAALQAAEGLPHVTLVLYDGAGKRQHVVQGITPSEDLVTAFETHLKIRPQS